MQSSGPFTFHPGDAQEIDIAFIWARDYTPDNPSGSVAKLQSMTDHVRQAFLANQLPGGGLFYGMSDGQSSPAAMLRIHPNPARDQVTVTLAGFGKQGDTKVELQTLQGETIMHLAPSSSLNQVTFSVAGMPDGVYLVRASNNRQVALKKMIVLH